MFKTAYGERERHYIEAGRELQNEYGYEVNKLGQKVLVKTGETNLYEKIQESHEETKIENILKSVVNGDTSMLRANGQFIDTTELPNNLIEARQAIQNLENTWQSLPNEIKAKYHNSVEEYVGKAGTHDWLVDMGMLKPIETEKPFEREIKKEAKENKVNE